MLEILEKRLKTEGITYYKITGENPKEKRLQLVKEFNEKIILSFISNHVMYDDVVHSI